MPFTPRYAIFYAIYPKLCYRLCHIPRSSAIFFLNVMLQYITLTPSYANSSYAMFSGQSQGRISGYCCIFRLNREFYVWIYFRSSSSVVHNGVKIFLISRLIFCMQTLGLSASLPNNYNHQIYRSNSLVLFMTIIFYQANLPVTFMIRKLSTAKKVWLEFISMKSTGKFDR